MTEDEKRICERFVRLIDTGFTPEEKEVLIPQLFHYYASFCAKDILMRLKSYGTRIDAEEVKKEAIVYGGCWRTV